MTIVPSCATFFQEGNTMTTHSLSRFSISMPSELVSQLDAMSKDRGFASRSQAVADIVRDRLVEHYGQAGKCEIVGTVTLVYDHHKRNVQEKLTAIQHGHQDLIIATLHVHLDHHNCLEILAVRGLADVVKKVADSLIAVKGVKHGKLTLTASGEKPARRSAKHG